MSLLPLDNEEFSLEIRDASPCHLLTKIKSFPSLSKHGISKLESTEFEAGDYKWKVIIYPDGDEIGKKVDHISIYLSIIETSSLAAGWEVNAIFNFFLYNHNSDNYLCFRGKARRFHAINSKLRFSKFIDKRAFTEPSNGYLSNDNCVFGAEVFVINNHRFVESVSVFDLKDPYEHEWEVSDFSKYEKAWSSEEFFAGGYNWKIKLCPNGISSAQDRYVSIFLWCIDAKSFAAHKKVKATCFFILQNRVQNQKNHSEKVSHWFTCSDHIWGILEFKAISDMGDGGFLVKDSCLLKIQLSVEAIQEALN